MKTCPTCGYQGEQDNCPNDGEPLLTPEALRARGPADPTQAPAADNTNRQHAPAKAPDEDAEMRGDDYGQWAEPSLPKKKKKDPMIGRMVSDRYEVQGLLGKGGMGAVYKAYQANVQRTIALKVLLKEFADNEVVIKRFHQEALAASRLTHPNTISVYDFGQTEDNVLYIAMEYLRGQSLAQMLAGAHGLPPKRAIHIMRQVCKSLAEAHDAGIIHRDLKPDNIFLSEVQGERDFVKVLDFGVAKLSEYHGKEGTLTQAGMIFGTPKYMSPEQARSGDLDHRSDIYALGVILYEMLLGVPPFVGDNPLSILIAHVNQTPAPFAEKRPDLDLHPGLERVVLKAMAKDRSQRHDKVIDLLRELDALDELLAGATWDSVADRLPGTLPGVSGPSLVGPAIVPGSTDGTFPQASAGGGTIVLDAQGNPIGPSGTEPLGVGNLDLTTPDIIVEERRGPPVAMFAGLAAMPVLGFLAWALIAGPEKEAQPDAAKPIAMAVDASRAAPPKPDAAPKVAAKAPDAGVADAAAKPKVVKKGRVFVIASTPPRVPIYDARSGRKMGITVKRLRVTSKRKYVLRKAGYESKSFTLKPTDDNSDARHFTLKAKAVPEARPKTVPVKVPAKDPVKVVPKVKPKPECTLENRTMGLCN